MWFLLFIKIESSSSGLDRVESVHNQSKDVVLLSGVKDGLVAGLMLQILD